MANVTVNPLVPGLQPITLTNATPDTLSDVIRTYRANGIPYRIHYGATEDRKSVV